MKELLGTSKVTRFNKITLIKEVAKELNIKEGDLIAFWKEGNRIYITKAKITE